MPIVPGTRLGQYEVQDFIGQGAMGLVYRAYHSQLQRTGAVKVMQAIAPDPDAVARFRHEAQAIAQMRHPNILNVYDFGEYQGTPYMIVEFVPGGSLADRLGRGPLDNPTSIKYLRGIAAGLDYAHSRGVVHRDVKPANVLLTMDDTPVLADFGLAKLLQGSSLKSMTGVTTGTPAYMAPEQVMGSQVGPAADRYALATIAYEMATGFIPFEGQALLELLYAQVHRYPEPPSSRNHSLGADVDAVVMRGLGKDPATRWPSCAVFVDAFEVALMNRTPDANARTVVMKSPAPVDVTSKSPAPTPASRPKTAATVAAAYPSPPPAPPAAPPARPRAKPAPAPTAEPALVEFGAPPLSALHGPITAPPTPPPGLASPPVATPQRRSRKALAAAVSGIVIFVIGLVAVAAYAYTHQPPVLNLSTTTVSPGDTLVVNATGIPPNQAGDFQLYSQVYSFPFLADANGQVTTSITIPGDVQPGDHQLKICWSGTCPSQADLTVLAVVVPSPTDSPSPSAFPNVTASPISSSPPSPDTPRLVLSRGSVAARGSLTIDSLNFPPRQSVTVNFVQNSSGKFLTTATTSALGSFRVTVSIPATAVPGPASVRACTPSLVCAFASITITA